MLQFTPLASSSAGCCYRVACGGAKAPLLIEAGIRFELIRRGLDFQVSSLAGCLVSHAHGDHCRAAGELMRAGVDCYASPETWKQIDPDGRLLGHRSKAAFARQEFAIEDWTVLPFEAVHDTPGTLGFVVGSPDGSRLLYLTDSAYSPFTFPGLTHMAVECNWSSEALRRSTAEGRVHHDRFRRTVKTHMSLERLIDMLKANDLSKVEEIHLLHLSDDNSDEEGFKLAVQRATGKPVYVAAA
jgi:phosphoribosyl 1,2-cyclic phosphodiesterase